MSSLPALVSAFPLSSSEKHLRRQARAYQAKTTGTPVPLNAIVACMLTVPVVGIAEVDALLSGISALNAVQEKPNDVSKDHAKLILEKAVLFDILPNHVTASAEGGVGICFEAEGKYADIECFNTGEIWALLSDRKTPARTWQIDTSPFSIIDALLRINSELNA